MYASHVAMIMFACVSSIHMGLIPAIERIIGKQLMLVNCPKCLTFWFVLFYSMATGKGVVLSVSASFLAAYLAIWLELLLGYTDTLYNKLYEKIYPYAADGEIATDTTSGDTDNSMS